MSRYLKLFFLVAVWLTTPALASNPESNSCLSGTVLEGRALASELLGRDVAYAIYLPPDYDCSSRRYPVVYLLHGLTDDETGWIQFGEANRIADQGILSGDIPPMIIVMPDGGLGWYVDDYTGKQPYEKMFVSELIPHIDATYRTRTLREYRGVAGLSMGGFGSLMLAMRNPETFVAVAAFSSGVRTAEEIVATPQEHWDRVYTVPFGKGLVGQERLTPHYQAFDPLNLAESLPIETLKKIRWYIDCGDDDFLYKGNAALHVILRDRNIPHEFRVRDGGHQWGYWRSGLPEGLKFIGHSFHR